MKNKRPMIAAVVLTLSTLACRPVFAIGADEILIILALIVFLMWPILVRFYRAWQKTNHEDKEKKKK